MRTENEDRLVALGHFVGFKIEKIDDISLALVRTNTPIIQLNEDSNLSDAASAVITAVFDKATEFSGEKDDVDSRVDALSAALTDFDSKLWANVRKQAPDISFNAVRLAYFKSVESIVNASEGVVREYVESEIDPSFGKYYDGIFEAYNKMRTDFIQACKDQEERN